MNYQAILAAFIGCVFAITVVYCVIRLALSQKHDQCRNKMENFQDFVKETLSSIKKNCACFKQHHPNE